MLDLYGAGSRLKAAIQLWKMRKRISQTTNDRTADSIPKVKGAGKVMLRDCQKVQRMHNGLLVTYGGYHGDWMAKIIEKLQGHHEPVEELWFHHVLQRLPEDAIMLEVGCYWAYYSLWFRHGFPKRRNFLIEPNPQKMAVGIKNFQLNKFEGDFSTYFIADSVECNAPFEDETGILNAPAITIDAYLAQKQIAHLHMLHADIQGAELVMLNGARSALLNKAIDYIFISTHGDKHHMCVDKLKEFHYTVIFEHSIEESSSADGLLVAASPNASLEDQLVAAISNKINARQ